MKKIRLDMSWLPSGEEWDFRAVAPAECRVACDWEYSRELRLVTEPAPFGLEQISGANIPSGNMPTAKSPRLYCPVHYHHAARALFPRAWLTLTREQRAAVVGSFSPIPALQVRKLGDFFQRMGWTRHAPLDIPKQFLEHCYVVVPNFSGSGVEAVIKGFENWARKEARCYPPARHAKAAQLPFDALKWLSVSRLEPARRKARVSFEQAQEALREYRRQNPLADTNDAFPIYSSHGAWSKARAYARRCLNNALRQPDLFLAGLY
jgi:hypothetical protein